MQTPTKREEETLKELTSFRRTVKQTASRLNISKRMVYKYIDRLRDKGLLNGSSYLGFTKGDISPHPPSKKVHTKPLLRLHGIQFSIKTFNKTNHRRRIITFKNHKIIIYPFSIQIYTSGKHFTGSTTNEALREMFKFYDIFFMRVQDRYKIPFYKEGKDNISLVDGEIEEYNGETGKWLKKEDMQRLQVRGTNDGIVWLEYDKSLKGDNVEVKNPKTFIPDSQLIFDGVFNSWRDGKALTPLQTTKAISDIVMSMKWMEVNNKSHTKAVQDLSAGIKQLVKITKARKSSRGMYQRTLGEFQ